MEKYESYKPSGVSWIGEIPSHWDTMRIKFYCDSISSGATPKTSVASYWNGDIPWIPSGCCHDCNIGEAPKFITKEGLRSCSTQVVPAGTTVMAMTGATCSQVGFLTIDAATNQSVMAYIENKRKADAKFLFYLLQGAREYILTHQTGGAQAGIDGQDCSNLLVPFVPFEEQKAIAAFLDSKCAEIDKAIAIQSKKIDLLNELRQAVITKAVTGNLMDGRGLRSKSALFDFIPSGWAECQIKNVIIGIQDGTHGSFARVPGGRYLLSAKNVFEDGLHLGSNESNISEQDYKSIISNGYPAKGDIAICCVGTIGRCCIYSYDEIYAFQRSVTFLRPKNTINTEFLLYVLRGKKTQMQLEQLAKTSAQSGIYMGALASVHILLPPRFQQDAIVNQIKTRLTPLDNLLSLSKKEVELLKQYKQSLITEVVTGKRKVC